ncbi:MAG: CbiX/SirB N-terminal domain-containing protein [Candidatus Riflebacteria bacterium]|nr:CbiX/SirB N-terminal domain-containing protein [Candidatus Riflebacteria bacterium]
MIADHSNIKTCVILLFHGSRLESAKKEAMELAEHVSSTLARPVVTAFLQMAEPAIEQALKDAVVAGNIRIHLYPMFTLTGRHIEEDLPKILSEFRSSFPRIQLHVEPHLGADPAFQHWLCERLSHGF